MTDGGNGRVSVSTPGRDESRRSVRGRGRGDAVKVESLLDLSVPGDTYVYHFCFCFIVGFFRHNVIT